MNRIYIDILKGFKEIGELNENDELVSEATKYLDEAIHDIAIPENIQSKGGFTDE